MSSYKYRREQDQWSDNLRRRESRDFDRSLSPRKLQLPYEDHHIRDRDRERTPPREQNPRKATAPYHGRMQASPGSIPRARRESSRYDPDHAHEQQNYRHQEAHDRRGHSPFPESAGLPAHAMPKGHNNLLKHIHNGLSDLARSSATHWDEKKVIDLDLPRLIQTTDWSEQKRIAGYPIDQVPLAAITYQGLNNWVLRHLAQGRSTFVVLCRKYPESRLLHDLGTSLYKSGVDVETTIKQWAAKQDPPVDTNTNEQLWIASATLAGQIAQHIKTIGSANSDNQLFKRIEQLEADLAAAKQPQTSKKPVGKSTNQADSAVAPTSPFTCQGDKILSQMFPGSKQSKEVNSWIKRLGLSKKGHNAKDQNTIDISKFLAGLDKAKHKNALQGILVDWGLTIEQAGAHDVDSATKIIAAVKAYASTKAPENKLKF